MTLRRNISECYRKAVYNAIYRRRVICQLCIHDFGDGASLDLVHRNRTRMLVQGSRDHFGVFVVKLFGRIHSLVGFGQQLLGVRPVLRVKGRAHAER